MRQYKDSGIKCIGKIPDEWKVGRIKNNIVFNPENTNSDEELEVSYMPMDCLRFNQINERTAKYHDVKSYTPFEEGDIVMAKVTPCYENGNIAIAKNLRNGRGYGTSEIFVIRALSSLSTKYLFYYLNISYVINRSVSSMIGTGGLKRINPAYFLNTKLLIPPASEQQRIADYLDEKCREIDSLIGLQERMIEKLKVYKQSVITEAVTKGLDLSAKFVSSGIDCIDDIPEGWKVIKTKYIADKIFKGNGITKEEVFVDGDTPCVRYGEIYSKYNHAFSICLSATNVSIQKSPQYFSCGDLLCAGTGELVEEIGKSIVYLGNQKCLAGGDIIVVQHKQNPSFLNYAFNSNYAQTQKSKGKAKLKVVHISAFEIGNIYIILPPISEQNSIASYLDYKCADIDCLISLKQKKIEKLKEYKKSLICEVVTGKINID